MIRIDLREGIALVIEDGATFSTNEVLHTMYVFTQDEPEPRRKRKAKKAKRGPRRFTSDQVYLAVVDAVGTDMEPVALRTVCSTLRVRGVKSRNIIAAHLSKLVKAKRLKVSGPSRDRRYDVTLKEKRKNGTQ